MNNKSPAWHWVRGILFGLLVVLCCVLTTMAARVVPIWP